MKLKFSNHLYLVFLVFGGIPFALSANANGVGQFAKYSTTVRSGMGPESLVGTSELKILSQDANTRAYQVQITHQTPDGKITQKLSRLIESELIAQSQGTVFHHCSDHYGTSSPETIQVKNQAFQACLIKSSNTEMAIGLVPFSILKSVSTDGHGKTFTTLLTDF